MGRVNLISRLVAVVLVAAGLVFSSQLVLAQDGERFVDLSVDLFGVDTREVVQIVVGNTGNQAAYDVEVTFEGLGGAPSFRGRGPILSPAGEAVRSGPWPEGTWLENESGSVLIDEHGNHLDASGMVVTGVQRRSVTKFIWKIPVLEAGASYEISAFVTTSVRSRVVWYVASVTSASSFESETRLGNNRDQVWQSWGSTRVSSPEADYLVRVFVDDRHPSAGDTVNFMVVAEIHADRIADGCVNVRLTDGLTAGTPSFTKQAGESFRNDPVTLTDSSFASSTTRACGDKSAATGFFLLPQQTTDFASTMTLPVTVASTATVSEQCLTAEVFALPPAGVGGSLDDGADNRVEFCLGYPPIHVFDEGDVNAWTVYACKYGTGENKCDTAAEVQVDVFASTSAPVSGHGHGHGAGDIYPLGNATALIHVKDVPGRVFDDPTSSNNKSITSLTTVSWQTATAADPDFTGTRNGVKVGLFRAPVNAYISNWTNYHPTFRLSGLDGGNPPGSLAVRSRASGRRIWTVLSSGSPTAKRANPFSLSSQSTVVIVNLIEFDQLGTYVVDFDVDMLHASIDSNSDGTKDTFTGTGRTIFHVGPIAELGVVDGGASWDAEPGQVAFRVLGVNNRDEAAHSGRVVVELPAGTTGLTTVPANTGTLSGTTWTWDISGLELAGRLASQGKPEGVPVTLIVEGVSEGATATARVVYDAYEVCVGRDTTVNPAVPKTEAATTQAACNAISGASWHSGTVFDYDASNNTATLTARRGAVGPALPQAPAYTAGVMVRWGGVGYVWGIPVAHYEVQRSSSPWTTVADGVEGLSFLDTTAEAGKSYQYRVRPVSMAGVRGAWSQAAGVAVPAGALTPGAAAGNCTRVLGRVGTVSGSWVEGCRSLVRDGSLARYFTFVLEERSEVTVDLSAGGVDTYLYLRQGNNARSGGSLLENDDFGGTRSSRIQALLDPGTYTVEATTHLAEEPRSFALGLQAQRVSAFGDGRGGGGCVTALGGNTVAWGVWTPGCASQERQRWGAPLSRFYTFTVNRPATFDIDLRSVYQELAATADYADGWREFNWGGDYFRDTYLYLRRGDARSGPALVENDCDPDARYCDRSRVRAELADGTYTIEATADHGPNQGWPFVLTVDDGLGGTRQQIGTPPPGLIPRMRVVHHGDSLRVEWDAAARADTYHITYRPVGQAEWLLAEKAHRGTSLSIDLPGSGADNRTYEAAVRAQNAGGYSQWANSQHAAPRS